VKWENGEKERDRGRGKKEGRGGVVGKIVSMAVRARLSRVCPERLMREMSALL